MIQSFHFLVFTKEYESTNCKDICTLMFITVLFTITKIEKLHSQQKQDQELIVAQIMNFLLPNSDLN